MASFIWVERKVGGARFSFLFSFLHKVKPRPPCEKHMQGHLQPFQAHKGHSLRPL